jgi:uncharacterized protein YbjT (DUF2867 family)
MRLFITGGTGFVGREVLRQAHAAAHSLRILVRKPDSASVLELSRSYRVELHPGDVLDPVSLKGALTEVDAVIHLVGIISECGQNTFENLHIRSTQNVVAAAQDAGIKRFVYMSALGTRPGACSRYHQTKWQAEEAVRKSGLDFTIFRPSLIYGPEDNFVNLFERMARYSPVLPVMGSSRARFQPVGVEAVAAAFIRCLPHSESVGKTFDLCGPETFTFPQLLDQILAVTNRRRLKLRMPLPLAWLQAVAVEFLYKVLLRRPPPLNRDQLVMLQEDNVGEGRAADEMFSLRHTDFQNSIRSYLRPL